MYLATKPSYRPIVSATHCWYAPETSRRSSGSRRVESAVESTTSQNITVIWRRSAAGTPLSADGCREPSSLRKAAIAASILRRCPTRPTPRSLRSSAVNSGSIARSMALSRNACSYCCSPRPWSHAAMSTLASPTRSLPCGLSYPNCSCARILRRSSQPMVTRHIMHRYPGDRLFWVGNRYAAPGR